MNNAKKIASLIVSISMMACATGCGDQSWSYKSGDVSLSAGSYIYNLLNGYYEGYDLVESPDEIKKKDLLSTEVKDSDEEKKTLEQYALDMADETSLRMVAIEQLFSEYDLELDETEDEAARSYADQVWTTAKKTLEGYGIGEESFTYCYADYSVKYGQVFEHLYGAEGEKAVSDDELRDYFANNFKGYAFFSYSMSETNSDGESVAKAPEEFTRAENNFAEYAEMLNSGEDYKKVARAFSSEYGFTYDPTYSGAFKNEDENTTFAQEVYDAVMSLDEGKATVVTTGEDATKVYYLVYRPKNADIEDYLKTESSYYNTNTEDNDDEVYIYDLKSGYTRYTMLDKMKSDDFKTFLTDKANSMGIKKNESAIKKYKVKMFIKDDDE